MAYYPIRGKLRFKADTLQADAAYVRMHVSELSKPELRSVSGTEGVQFWWAEFGASAEEWNALQPELRKRGVMGYLADQWRTVEDEAKIEDARQEYVARQRRRKMTVFLGVTGIMLSMTVVVFMLPASTGVPDVRFECILALIVAFPLLVRDVSRTE